MLRPHPHPYRMSHHALQSRYLRHHLQLPRGFQSDRWSETLLEHLVSIHLHHLRHARRKLPPLLHARQQLLLSTRPSRSGSASKIGRGHRILDRQIDSHAPAGDMACAASPMHSRPGRCHFRSRLICTVSSLI